jgi:hypothetical protein
VGTGHGPGLQIAGTGGVCRGGQAGLWWNDEGLKALSARVVRAAPDDAAANLMQAIVLSRQHDAWEAGPRSAAELKEAATHFDRAAALCPAPAGKASLAGGADWCRSRAEAMYR